MSYLCLHVKTYKLTLLVVNILTDKFEGFFDNGVILGDVYGKGHPSTIIFLHDNHIQHLAYLTSMFNTLLSLSYMFVFSTLC